MRPQKVPPDRLPQRRVVAEVASQIFGTTVKPGHVIGETPVRATAADIPGLVTRHRIVAPAAPADYTDLAVDPLASWAETEFGLARDS